MTQPKPSGPACPVPQIPDGRHAFEQVLAPLARADPAAAGSVLEGLYLHGWLMGFMQGQRDMAAILEWHPLPEPSAPGEAAHAALARIRRAFADAAASASAYEREIGMKYTGPGPGPFQWKRPDDSMLPPFLQGAAEG